MDKQPSGLWEHLRRSLAADPGRFAGGSAVSDPLGLLAVEQERVAAPATTRVRRQLSCGLRAIFCRTPNTRPEPAHGPGWSRARQAAPGREDEFRG